MRCWPQFWPLSPHVLLLLEVEHYNIYFATRLGKDPAGLLISRGLSGHLDLDIGGGLPHT